MSWCSFETWVWCLDAEALDALEAEAAEKRAEEEEKQRQKGQEREERQWWKDEAAIAKAMRAAEAAQRKLDWLAEKERKVSKRAENVAKKLLGPSCMQLGGVVGMPEDAEEVLGRVESKEEVGVVVQVLDHPCHSQWNYQVNQTATMMRTSPGASIVTPLNIHHPPICQMMRYMPLISMMVTHLI